MSNTRAPVIACNTNWSVTTGNPLGSNVTFSTTATDNNGYAAAVCVPASGQTLRAGRDHGQLPRLRCEPEHQTPATSP